MSNVLFDFGEIKGKIKPMNAVNNGPVMEGDDQTMGNSKSYAELKIPYARNHDAAFYSDYGGEHTVDVHAIFKNFDADPYDPASYDFVMTDIYSQTIENVGTKVYYRLGSKIEHNPRKFGTLVPPDFQKWAVICEHIIRHLTEGWADGLHLDIEYWEIWNEPDLDDDDAANKRNWQGTAAEYYELYNVASKHLKECFPNLKIGGPALSSINRREWLNGFLKSVKESNSPLDFFSWHRYTDEVKDIIDDVFETREILDSFGFTKTESILNEWNYIKGWSTDFVYSLRMQYGLKGAAFALCTMLGCQKAPLDMLMYYDARPSGFNGLWDKLFDKLKGWYAYRMFADIVDLGTEAGSESDDDEIYVLSATGKNGKNAAILCYYSDDDNAPDKTVTVNVKGGNVSEVYLLDKDNDNKKINVDIKDGKFTISLGVWSALLIK